MESDLIIPLSIIVIAAGYAVYVELCLRKGTLHLTEEYSYKKVFLTATVFLMGALVVSSVVYIMSDSIDVTATLLVFFVACIFIGLAKGLLFEYQIKRRINR